MDTELRQFGWLYDELMLWEPAHQHVELSDNDDFEDDTTLCLNLINNPVSEEEESAMRLNLAMLSWLYDVKQAKMSTVVILA